MSRRDGILLLLILAFAGILRVEAPWSEVFRGGRVNFLETDAWYHVRRVEFQVRNFPHLVTDDPYAADGGLYVPLAPLFDTLISSAVWMTAGRDATSDDIERAAAFAPVVLGGLAVLAVWAFGRLLFGGSAALFAALFAAILPGHFLDRTLLGFVDHHALEVCLAFAVLAALAWTLREEEPSLRRPDRWVRAVAAGVLLALYLLGWGSGSLFVAIVAVWTAVVPIAAGDRAAAAGAGRMSVIAAMVALALVWLLQDPRLYRYDLQVTALVGWAVLAALVWKVNGLATPPPRAVVLLILCFVALAAMAATWTLAPGLASRVATDVGRFGADTSRMAVLEARPLFLYSGRWDWWQPWTFFGTGFYLGVVGTLALAYSTWRSRRLDHLLLIVMTVAMFGATLGQNRFGYYLVPATAVVMGWMASTLLHRAGLARMPAIALVAAVFVAPNVRPAVQATHRTSAMTDAWHDTMMWLRSSTPEPFAAGETYYTARYDRLALARPAFTVMNWWDQGYWLVQAARRVPVANPTQAGAVDAGAFYTATTEAEAVERLGRHRARYAIVDWELPFRHAADGSLAGRFESLVQWSGRRPDDYYRLCYEQGGGRWIPTWLFLPAYYQSMAYRLMVMAGRESPPSAVAWLVRIRDRVDVDGRRFCEVIERAPAPTDGSPPPVDAVVVGLDPWQPPFQIPALPRFHQVHESRQSNQPLSESPMVRVFEVRP